MAQNKKDFSAITNGYTLAAQQMQTAQGIQEEHTEQEEQKTQKKPRKRYTPEEARQILESGRSGRGLGGVHSPRINMAFTLENYDFVITLARMRGETYTEFVNHLVDMSREKYKEQYEQAKRLKNSF